MSDRRLLILADEAVRRRAVQALLEAPLGNVVRIGPPKRSLVQNAAQWPILEAFAEQLMWPVNGRMTKLSAEEFKDILTAAFRQETVRLAEGLNGGVVMLGSHTSDMDKPVFSEWLDFLHATAAGRGVNLGPNV